MCMTGPDGVHSYEKHVAKGHTRGKLAENFKDEPQIPLRCRSGATGNDHLERNTEIGQGARRNTGSTFLPVLPRGGVLAIRIQGDLLFS
mmetsp:Transcript_10197/g.20529  ORF Transcript_10197/g.20529 Transcript_10197/m.20529 type:complete len:89 (+) Transcript_10197:133-399(+)